MVRSTSRPPVDGLPREFIPVPPRRVDGSVCDNGLSNIPSPPPRPVSCRAVRSGSLPVRLNVAAEALDERKVTVSSQSPATLAQDRSESASVVTLPSRLAKSLPLHLGDKIYWISDFGAEYGEVRWLGKLPQEDGGREWMVGVEFVNDVGSGNGCYHGHRLFTARMNHASIVPISGLIRADDFQTTVGNAESLKPEPCAGRKINLELHTSDEDEISTLPRAFSATGQMSRSYDPQFSENLDHMSPFQHLVHQQLLDGRSRSPAVLNRNSIGENKSMQWRRPKSLAISRLKVKKGKHGVGPDSQRHEVLTNSDHITSSNTGTHTVLTSADEKSGNFSVGTAVECTVDGCLSFGVLRWTGKVHSSDRLKSGCSRNVSSNQQMVGVELEDHIDSAGDGCFNGVRYFSAPPGRAIFLPMSDIRSDRRFTTDRTPTGPCATTAATDGSWTGDGNKCDFGSLVCPSVPGRVAPLLAETAEEFDQLCGPFKGIQGHLNSCYLDATLFCMFAFSSALDCVLFRPRHSSDIPEYAQVQCLLREEIVNPLRSAMFVRADRVMKLRRQLDLLSSVQGLLSEEKDPEEFVQSLLAQTLKAEPFVRFSSGHSSYFYQLIVEKDDRLNPPTVQHLFEQSLFGANIKLREIPSCLIIQMPRHGPHYKLYDRILPSQLLDITDALADSPRVCCVCGRLASVECRQCFQPASLGLAATAYCADCDRVAHSHHRRVEHRRLPLLVRRQFSELSAFTSVPRCFMQLYAVICIETSHYVSFARAGSTRSEAGQDKWVFFDSMADRCGEANGFNIPQVQPAPEVASLISGEYIGDCQLPEHARRLLCDAYLCFYQSPDVMMYR